MHYPTTVTSPGGTIMASIVADGMQLPLYRRVDGRMFAPAAPGSEYTLRVANLTDRRVEVIVSIDGQHILRKESADPETCHGYLIAAHAVQTFKGWRVNDQESDRFKFGDLADSVAAQVTGEYQNIGAIGFAAWREYTYLPSFDSKPSFATAAADYSVRGSVTKGGATFGHGSVGTGIGERQHDPVSYVNFRREVGAPDILVLGYDTPDELYRRGILGPPDADPFPGTRHETGYGDLRHR